MITIHQIFEILSIKKISLSTAESCTGGLLGAAFTELPGSSEFYTGGVIAYDNRIKRDILNVPEEILQKFGAVSSETIIAMARGVQSLFNTDCSISTSGIAGPGGGSHEKPVGLVYIGIAYNDSVKSFKCHFSGDRESVRMQTVEKAIELLYQTIFHTT